MDTDTPGEETLESLKKLLAERDVTIASTSEELETLRQQDHNFKKVTKKIEMTEQEKQELAAKVESLTASVEELKNARSTEKTQLFSQILKQASKGDVEVEKAIQHHYSRFTSDNSTVEGMLRNLQDAIKLSGAKTEYDPLRQAMSLAGTPINQEPKKVSAVNTEMGQDVLKAMGYRAPKASESK